MKIDRLDLRILDSLQQDARISTTRLAEKIGLTPRPTADRMRRLRQHGVLRGYRTDIAVERLPPLVQLIVSVTLARHRAEDFQHFETNIARMSEVAACWAVGGDVDYMLHLVAASDARADAVLKQLIGMHLTIDHHRSGLVARSIKPYTGIPLQLLIAR
jgi:Lrp/AsnC family transcriptional regulator of ectoine degradation